MGKLVNGATSDIINATTNGGFNDMLNYKKIFCLYEVSTHYVSVK